MTDAIITVDLSDPIVLLNCYRKLNAENERLRERLAEADEANRRVSDEIVLQRQSIKQYVQNLTRITNDMLLEISISESKA